MERIDSGMGRRSLATRQREAGAVLAADREVSFLGHQGEASVEPLSSRRPPVAASDLSADVRTPHLRGKPIGTEPKRRAGQLDDGTRCPDPRIN